ncbi:MFS transporter [Clavibacter nebraskensis]|uniref:Multidrug efflux MFS permease n=3 Tax=Clavibacter nebraskensis TaxID=31963 RepID=A0AAI8ZGJ8_9MICO|nr:MFS transporter [Clavibacter nebraskensis]CCE74524.1 putative multidrug efflux MFS permease [Clavibacter nebraskensis NCPPB 2581]
MPLISREGRRGDAPSTAFHMYLAARLVSIAGASATTVVVPVLVYSSTGSAGLTGLIAAIGGATYFVFGIPVGHLVDRWPRGPVLVTCSITRGLALAIVPISAATGAFGPAVLVAVLVVTNVLFVATDAANAGSLRTLVGADGLQRANATVSGAAAVVEIAAPLAAGVALVVMSATEVFLLEAFALVISSVLLWSIRGRLDAKATRPGSRPAGGWSAALSGFAFIRQTRTVATTTAAAFVFALTEGLMLGQLVVLLSQRFGDVAGSALVAPTYTAIAAGSVLGSWILTRIRFADAPLRIAAWGFLLAAALLSGLQLPEPPWVTISLLAAWATPFVVVFVGAAALRQSVAEDSLQGRVAIASRLLTLGLGIPMGNVIGGAISGAASAQSTFAAAALVSAVAAAAFGLAAVGGVSEASKRR